MDPQHSASASQSVQPATPDAANRARDHLANERTFLAWVRTGVAIVVFGFAIGRFAIAIRQFMQLQGHAFPSAGITVWFGTIAIFGGVVLTVAGLVRYRRTRDQLESGQFQPAGFLVDLVGILVAFFGLALGAYLVFIQLQL
jgi:putative membrane protein